MTDELLPQQQHSLQTKANVALLQQTMAPTPPSLNYKHHFGPGDHYLLLSVILSVSFLLCVVWWALPCTLAAVTFSIKVCTIINARTDR